MIGIIVLALCLLLPEAALAQEAPAVGGTNAAPSPPPPSSLPLDALLHHQPTEGNVTEREGQRYGAERVQQQHRREQSDIDRLYDEVMRRSAPNAVSGGTVAPSR